MKEMVYQDECIREVLDRGIIDGYEYFILSLGTHPTAYINIPANHPAYGKEYEKIDIDVHGGLTYGERRLRLDDEKIINGWFIGWDYAHYGDMFTASSYRRSDKAWTTAEIHKEVENVIEQLKKMEAALC